MSDLEIPEGELLFIAGQLEEASDGFITLSNSITSIDQATSGGMTGGTSTTIGGEAGRNLDQRITHYTDRLQKCASDIASLQMTFNTLDAYYEDQFTEPRPGDPSKPI